MDFIRRFFNSQSANRTAVGVLTSTLAVADKLLDGFPIYGPKLAIGMMLEVLEGVDQTYQNVETLGELRHYVGELVTVVLEPISELQESQIPPHLAHDVERLTSELKRLSLEWNGRFSYSFLRRYFNRGADTADLTKFGRGIKQALTMFQISGMISLQATLAQVQAEMAVDRDGNRSKEERERAEARAKELSRLVESLPRAKHAGYDSGRADAPSSCFEGTRVAILNDIMAWVDDPDSSSSRLFWLNGLAGIGKSTIAKTIAARGSERGILGGSFFFSRGDVSLRESALVFPTLAFQLAQFDPAFKTLIGEAIEAEVDIAFKPLARQLDELIVKPLSRSPDVKRTVLIVLDALDECEEKGAEEILRLVLAQASHIPFTLRIFITSRPDAHIRSAFRQDHNNTKYILHNIEGSVVQQDIQLYLESELSAIPARLDLRMPAQWTTKEERNALLEGAGKLFIYATMVVRFIGNNRVRNPRRQLDILLGAHQTSKANPFAQLDILYLQILISALPEPREEEDVERFQTVVGSIVLLRDPLSMNSLARFTGVGIDTISDSLYHLHSIFLIPSTDDEAPRIYHPSFADFLTDLERCQDQDFAVTVPDRERLLALRCLELMTSMLRRDLAEVASPGVLNDEIRNLEGRVNHAISPELQYACRYWSSHLQRVTPGDEAVVEILEKFASAYMLWWFEVMSLLGSTSLAITCIHDAHQWAVNSQCDVHLVTLLHNAHRFILSHAEVIKAGASQIYYSALPFVPRETALFKAYQHELSGAVQVLQGVRTEWSSHATSHEGHSEPVFGVAISRDGSRVASGSADKTIRIWDATSGLPISVLRGNSDAVISLAFSPDGFRLASGSQDGTVRVWETSSGAALATMKAHADLVTCVAYSPSGSHIASCSWDETIRVWNAISFSAAATMKGHTDEISSVSFSQDGTRILSGSNDKTLRLWEAPIAKFHRHTGGPRSSVLSAFSDRSRIVSEYETISTSPIMIMNGHADWVTSVAFSPDGLRAASGSWDHSVCLWDTVSGELLATLEGHTKPVYALAFSDDGAHFTSWSVEESILWDALAQTQLTPAVKNESPEQIRTVAQSTSPSTSSIPRAIILANRWLHISRSAGEMIKVCRIPDEYWIIRTAEFGVDKMAIGCREGQVLILDFTQFYIPPPDLVHHRSGEKHPMNRERPRGIYW